MKKIGRLLGHLLFYYVIFGSVYLIYVQTIDGVYVNVPFTFDASIDHLALKTDKPVYRPGDTISILMSVCKHRNYRAITTWRLFNETVITYPSKGTVISGIGCLKDKWVVIGEIPPYAIPGLHHLESDSDVILNPLHTIYWHNRSVDFQVTKK